jgi:hypothetical protein
MKLKRILLSFCRFAAPALIVFGRSIVSKMTGNLFFTNPDPPLTDVTSAIDDVEKKAALAKDGSKLAKSDLKEAKKVLTTLLRSLVWYVEKIAKGDENILISSGFELSKEPEPSQRDDFWILPGMNPGELLIGCVAYLKAGAYIWQVSAGAVLPTEEKDWLFAGASTQRKTTLTGYTPETKRWFRVRPVTKDGLMPPSFPPILFPIS